jgi:hypothetical protein
MFVHDKRMRPHDKVSIDVNDIEVVSSFKLLGVTIDNKLTLAAYVADMRKKVYR